MIEVRETRLPGVGRKFSMRTHLGEDVCAVVHIDGRAVKSCTVLVGQASGASVTSM